jgi:hypothetical protein
MVIRRQVGAGFPMGIMKEICLAVKTVPKVGFAAEKLKILA